jgi:hypothetical protein
MPRAQTCVRWQQAPSTCAAPPPGPRMASGWRSPRIGDQDPAGRRPAGSSARHAFLLLAALQRELLASRHRRSSTGAAVVSLCRRVSRQWICGGHGLDVTVCPACGVGARIRRESGPRRAQSTKRELDTDPRGPRRSGTQKSRILELVSEHLVGLAEQSERRVIGVEQVCDAGDQPARR